MRELHSALARGLLPAGVRKSIKWVVYSGWFGFGCRRALRLLTRRPATIHVYPDDPRANGYVYAIKVIAHRLGCRFSTAPPKGRCVVMRWEDQTRGRLDERLERLAETRDVINYRCRDISKARVEEVFKSVFGYSSWVDPLTYAGECVEKSNANGKADGRVVTCPLKEAKEGRVYQILINTRVDDEFVDEMRVPVFGKNIPMVLTKFKKISDAFSYSVAGRLDEVADCLSPEEVKLILRFCDEIGLDCGEMDVLRDRTDARLYIIDANNTPCLHFAGFSAKEEREVVRRMRAAFEQAFARRVS